MRHEMSCPVELTRQLDGSVLVTFPEIPEALADGEAELEALLEAEDCLLSALGGLVAARRAIPRRRPLVDGPRSRVRR